MCWCSCSVPFLAPPLYTAPDDYTAISSQPVTFSSAPDQICIPISISDDGVVEETETFAVTLVTEDPAIVTMLSFAAVSITDSSGKYLLDVFFLAVMRQKIFIINAETVDNIITLNLSPQRLWLDSHSLHTL